MEVLSGREFCRHLLLLHLVVTENDTEGLSKEKVEEPKQNVVGVAGDLLLENSLEDHARDVNHHECESDAIKNTEDSNDDVFMEYCTESECQQHSESCTVTSTAAREVDMSYQVVVNWLIPLSPVLT